jgi:hypothetical protein
VASAKLEPSKNQLPWYKRWFSGSSQQVVAQRPAANGGPVSVAAPIIFSCELCGFSGKIRGVVYDHIKSAHKEVLDRNGRIREQPQGQQPPSP